MPTTSPDNIYYADSSTAMSAEAISAAEATSVQDALDSLIGDKRQVQTFVWANSAARSAQTGMNEGDIGYQSDANVYYLYNGTSWVTWLSDWITYTPTLTNITLGTSPTTAYRYRYIGRIIEVEFRIVLGTGGSVGTFPTMTLPLNSQALLTRFELRAGGITLFDVSAATPFPGAALANDTDVDKVRFYHTNTGAFTNLTSTAPFTWAVGDVLAGRFTYVPA